MTLDKQGGIFNVETMVSQTYIRWHVEPADLMDLTPEKARDLIVRCLLEVQKATLAQNERMLGHMPVDLELHDIAEGLVRLGFREVQEDFESPTRTGLMKVVQALARKSTVWGTPPDIVEHHKKQIAWVLRCLR